MMAGSLMSCPGGAACDWNVQFTGSAASA